MWVRHKRVSVIIRLDVSQFEKNTLLLTYIDFYGNFKVLLLLNPNRKGFQIFDMQTINNLQKI